MARRPALPVRKALDCVRSRAYNVGMNARPAAGAAPAETLNLRLAYRPPFGWPDMVAYFATRGIPGVEIVDRTPGAESYARSVRIDAVRGWLRVTQAPEPGQLALELGPSSLAPVLQPLIARLRAQFDLDADPGSIDTQLARDPLLARVIAVLPGTRVPGAFDAFELAVRAVLGQQVSVAGATTLSGRLVQRFGAPISTPFIGVTHEFPSAERLAATDPLEIATIGLPKARARTICNLASFVVEGGMDVGPGTTLDDAVRHLRSVAGIGEWTAQYIALRALRFADAFPAGDLGLQKAAGDPVTPRLTERQLLLRAQGWSPWRGYAALLLWHSLAFAKE